jgi:hypothetical protein
MCKLEMKIISKNSRAVLVETNKAAKEAVSKKSCRHRHYWPRRQMAEILKPIISRNRPAAGDNSADIKSEYV